MATFTPRQQHWQWFADVAAEPTEPTDQLAAEITKPTGVSLTAKVRLRVCINETGGKVSNNEAMTVYYRENVRAGNFANFNLPE